MGHASSDAVMCVMKKLLLTLAITTATATLVSASIITMKWEGTISSGNTIGGTYAIDDSIIGTPAGPFHTVYYGPVSLTVSLGSHSYSWHTGDYMTGGMYVFDNSQNDPSDVPRDVLSVASNVTGSQFDGHNVTWVRLYLEEWGTSLTEPPTVLTSQAIPSGPLSFSYGDIWFSFSDGGFHQQGISFSDVHVTAVPEPSTYITVLNALVIFGMFACKNRK
jgi:hypothetical protein